MSRPVVNKNPSLQQSVESALVAAAALHGDSQRAFVREALTVTAVLGSPLWTGKRGGGLVCLHRVLSSL